MNTGLADNPIRDRTMLQIYDRDTLVAEVDMVEGELVVRGFVDWAERFIEELRRDRTDEELFNSLTTRLRGHVWAGKVKDG